MWLRTTRHSFLHSTFDIQHSTFNIPLFVMRYPFEKHFLVCIGGRCGNPDRGIERGEFIHAELKGHNKKMRRKPLVRVCTVSCLDLCDHGPNMIADGNVYSHLTRELAREVYAGVMGDGPPRDDLQLAEAEFQSGSSAAVKK
jgi:(2Fe-2S) ferredoxin